MKLHFIVSLALLIVCSNMSFAKDGHHPVEELLPLPHPIKIIKPNKVKLKITADQDKQLDKKMLAVFPPKIHVKMDEAKLIEDRLLHAVLKEGKTKTELKDDLDNLTHIKRELADIHIDALNTLETILTKEQWLSMLQLLETEH